MTEKKHNNISTITLKPDNFSSTTKLANNEVKQPTGSKESINEKEYNPFEHRNVEHPSSTSGALIHLLKSSLGTGILAMPNAFKNGGLIFSFFGTLFIGFLCTYCVHILVSCCHDICRRSKIPSMGFAETCGAAFEYGPKPLRKFSGAARIFVDIALVVTYFMGNCVYIVFISESFKQLFDFWFPGGTFGLRTYMCIVMVPLLISTQVRELKSLIPYSFLANIFMIISFAITLYYMFDGIPSPKERNYFTSFSQLPMFFSTVIFAMEGIGVVMPVENNMEKPQYFLGCPGVLNSAMSIVVVLYATIGFFGYLKYGEYTEASVTLNLDLQNIPAQVVQVLIALAVFFTYNVFVYVPMDFLWTRLLSSKVSGTVPRNLCQIFLRCAFVMGTVGVAAAVQKLDAIIGLVGSICFSTLGLLIPAIVETILRWDGGLGAFNWRLIKNTLLAILAIFALVSGSVQSIQQLLKEDES